MAFKFFFFRDTVASVRVSDWEDLRDYLSLHHEDYEPGYMLAEDAVTLEEISTHADTAAEEVFEVVCVAGKPVGTCAKPASGDLLELLAPRRLAPAPCNAPLWDETPRDWYVDPDLARENAAEAARMYFAEVE